MIASIFAASPCNIKKSPLSHNTNTTGDKWHSLKYFDFRLFPDQSPCQVTNGVRIHFFSFKIITICKLVYQVKCNFSICACWLKISKKINESPQIRIKLLKPNECKSACYTRLQWNHCQNCCNSHTLCQMTHFGQDDQFRPGTLPFLAPH